VFGEFGLLELCRLNLFKFRIKVLKIKRKPNPPPSWAIDPYINMYSQTTNSPIVKNLCQVKQEKQMNKKKLNINLVHHLWLNLDQGRIDQVLHLSIGYLWKQLDHKKKVFKE
jgi:hypothetical protein